MFDFLMSRGFGGMGLDQERVQVPEVADGAQTLDHLDAAPWIHDKDGRKGRVIMSR